MNIYGFSFLQALLCFGRVLLKLFFLGVTITCLMLSLQMIQDRNKSPSCSRVARAMLKLYKMQKISQGYKLS